MILTLERSTTEPAARRPALGDAASIVTMVHLSWVAWVWAAISVIYAIIIASVACWGSLDESLWQSVAAGWRRWLILAAGVTTTTTLLRMLVRNGATRGLLSSASMVAMAVLAVLGTAWIAARYAVERLLFDRYGWPQVLSGETVFEWSDLGRVGVESTIVLATYFLCGWLIGAGFYRFGPAGGLALIIPCLVPAALVELVTSRDFGGIDIDALPEWTDTPPLGATAAGGLAIVAVTGWVARRVTREAALR